MVVLGVLGVEVEGLESPQYSDGIRAALETFFLGLAIYQRDARLSGLGSS